MGMGLRLLVLGTVALLPLPLTPGTATHSWTPLRTQPILSPYIHAPPSLYMADHVPYISRYAVPSSQFSPGQDQSSVSAGLANPAVLEHNWHLRKAGSLEIISKPRVPHACQSLDTSVL